MIPPSAGEMTMIMRKILPIIIFVLVAVPVAAQEWHPIGPAKDEKDWVQLKSGEWVRGNMDLFRDLKMEFDSDELDDLVIDWDDIISFRFPRNMTFVFEDQQVYSGSASMKDGVIRINTFAGPIEMPRKKLLSIIEGEPRELNFWSANASLGWNQRTGNTNQIDISTRLGIKREATRSRTAIDHRASFSEVADTQTVNNQRGTLILDLFISRKLFITAASYEFYSDKFQNIDYRNTIGAGVGYYIFRQSRIDWAVSLGGGYQVTEFISVTEGDDTNQKSGSVIPSTEVDWDITGDIELNMKYNSRLGVPDIKTSTHHAEADLSIDIYKDIFEITFSFVWDRVDNPQPFEDGTVPEKDDVKLIFGFGIEL
jgi:hypothetical protein